MTNDELIPPSDVAAERQLLGAALHNPQVIDDLTDLIEPGDFYRPAHETIWQAILHLHNANEPVDAIQVKDRLAATSDLNRVGGAPYLFDLVQGTLSAANVTYHGNIVARCAGQRRLIQSGIRITQLGYTNNGRDLTETQELARAEVDKATGANTGGETISFIGAEIDDTLTALEADPELHTSPWADLDHLIGGFAPGRLYIIGSRPGVGKTVCAVQIAAHHAARHKQTVALASLEMSRQEIHLRLLAQLAKIDYTRLERHKLDPTDWTKIANVRGKIAEMPLAILDRSNVRLADIRRYARSVSRQGQLGMIVVDYLQLMTSPPGRQPRHEVVAEFSRGLKLLARELNVPVLAMSQLNRASEQRADKMPSLADMRESGAVEQDADVVILLHRDLNDETKRGDLNVGIAKNRHGTVGGVTLQFDGHYQRAVTKAWTPHKALGGAA